MADGDRRQSLIAVRDRLAAELDGSSGRDFAVLSKELRAVLAELDKLPGREESKLDRLAARLPDELASQRQRREARQPDAASS